MAKLHIDVSRGVFDIEGEESFINQVIEQFKPQIQSIQAGIPPLQESHPSSQNQPLLPTTTSDKDITASPTCDNLVTEFATELGIRTEEVIGALRPQTNEPFISLDERYWEAFKKNFPPRGQGSIAAIPLAATLLCLWQRKCRAFETTSKMCTNLLASINVAGPNPSRGIKQSEWLQLNTGGKITLNPAELSKAESVAKAFCTKAGLVSHD